MYILHIYTYIHINVPRICIHTRIYVTYIYIYTYLCREIQSKEARQRGNRVLAVRPLIEASDRMQSVRVVRVSFWRSIVREGLRCALCTCSIRNQYIAHLRILVPKAIITQYGQSPEMGSILTLLGAVCALHYPGAPFRTDTEAPGGSSFALHCLKMLV